MGTKISTSIMCADFGNLREVLKKHENAGIDYIHVDIMDGQFVPNFTFGPDFCKALRTLTAIPLDIHLMVERPERHTGIWDLKKGDIVTVHAEATNHIQKTLSEIKAAGASAGIAINPGTPVSAVEPVLPDTDMVLVMTVNPGYAGQSLVPQTLEKIAAMRAFLDKRGFSHIPIEVDGNVSFENAAKMRKKGAEIFVAGSSSVYRKDMDFDEAVRRLREAIR
jgi:ribulose-phosphate 3-epimerase